jgi:hypothetical protein
MGTELVGVDYPESQILGLLKIDRYPYADDAVTLFTEGDWSFLIQQFPDGYHFLAGNAADGGSPQTDSDEALLAAWQWRLDRVAPGARAHDPIWLSRFFLHNRQAEHYRRGRMLLAGDAAHLFSPASGEGMNTGMQDAFNLAWKLALVALGEAPEALLESYAIERRQAAIEIGAAADKVERDREITDPALQARRNRTAAAPQPALVLREIVASQSELAHSYRASPLSQGFHGAKRPRHHRVAWCGPWPGDRLPDALPLIDGEGAQRSLYDLAWRERLTLVILAGMADSTLVRRHQELANAVADGFGAAVEALLIVQADAPPCAPGFSGQIVADPVDSAHGRLGVLADTLLLVRPDGYVAFRSEPPDRHALFRALQAILGTRAGSG